MGFVLDGTVNRIDQRVTALEAGAVNNSTPITATGSTTPRQMADRFADVVNVKDFGATGNGSTDDTAAIQAAIDYAVTGLASFDAPEVYFPPGQYAVSSTLTVPRSHIRLVGQSRVVGASIKGTASGMGSVIKVTYGGGGFGHYGFQMINLRVEAASALASPPHGLHLQDASEFLIDNCYFGFNLNAGIKFDGVGGGIVRASEFSTNAIGLYFTRDAASIFPFNGETWLHHLNIYNHSDAAIKVDSTLDRLTVRDCWAEDALYGLSIVQTANANMEVSDLLLENFKLANGPTSPYTSSGVRYIRVQAMNTATYSFTLARPVIRNGRASLTQTSASPYAIEFLKNSNSNPNTSVTALHFDGLYIQGPSSAVFSSDFYTPGQMTGSLRAVNQAGSVIPLHTSGTLPVGVTRAGTGAVSSDNGDANLALSVGLPRVQRFATTLTANRTVTLPASGMNNGDEFRIVRTGLGAFTLDVGGLKTIPSATAAFVDVTYDGSAWRLTGYGTL